MTFVRIEKTGPVERWTIDRPERGNALGTSVATELQAALVGFSGRILVLGAAPVVKSARRTWIAGGDLKELAGIDTREAAAAYATSLAGFIDGLDALPVPVIVTVDGAAIGGGAELALAGDVRLATRAARWEFRQLRVGLATGYASAGRLVRMFGAARATGLVFLGETIESDEALKLGVTHRVVEGAAELEALTQSVVQDLLSLSPEALAAQKAMFRLAAPASGAAGEVARFAEIWRNPGHARFLDGFVGKGAKA